MNGLVNSSWTTGLCFLPLLAYLTRSWVKLGLLTSSVTLIFLLYWKYVYIYIKCVYVCINMILEKEKNHEFIYMFVMCLCITLQKYCWFLQHFLYFRTRRTPRRPSETLTWLSEIFVYEYLNTIKFAVIAGANGKEGQIAHAKLHRITFRAIFGMSSESNHLRTSQSVDKKKSFSQEREMDTILYQRYGFGSDRNYVTKAYGKLVIIFLCLANLSYGCIFTGRAESCWYQILKGVIYITKFHS